MTLEGEAGTRHGILVRIDGSVDGAAGGWGHEGVPREKIAHRLRGKVGLEIGVARLEGKLKFNQDKSAADRAGVRAALSAREAGRDTAAFMDRLERRSDKGD